MYTICTKQGREKLVPEFKKFFPSFHRPSKGI
jgi:hypothetical protein